MQHPTSTRVTVGNQARFYFPCKRLPTTRCINAWIEACANIVPSEPLHTCIRIYLYTAFASYRRLMVSLWTCTCLRQSTCLHACPYASIHIPMHMPIHMPMHRPVLLVGQSTPFLRKSLQVDHSVYVAHPGFHLWCARAYADMAHAHFCSHHAWCTHAI